MNLPLRSQMIDHDDGVFIPKSRYQLRFSLICLIFIYIFQYPLLQQLPIVYVSYDYEWADWVRAYIFTFASALIFMVFLKFGLSGGPVRITSNIQSRLKIAAKPSFQPIFLLFVAFFFWSYLMLKFKIGMTIYTDFEPLPYRLTGFLFYGRLFVQPLILTYIAYRSADSKGKWLFALLLFALGAFVSLTSGSRFAALMFSLPMFMLFRGRKRYLASALTLIVYIYIASLTRSFFLPFLLNDEYIEIYANAEYQASALENIFLLPIIYLATRSMGIGEVLLVMNYNELSLGFMHSLQLVLAHFVPIEMQGPVVSVKNVYGLSDDTFGGFGLDMFSNYLVLFGGDFFVYGFTLAAIAWMLGKTHRLFIIGLRRLDFSEGSMLVFVLLFVLVFEGRAFTLPPLLLVAWFFSKRATSRTLSSMLDVFVRR